MEMQKYGMERGTDGMGWKGAGRWEMGMEI
jgi:hypothetical protein